MDNLLPSPRSNAAEVGVQPDLVAVPAPAWLVVALRRVAASLAEAEASVDQLAFAAAQHLGGTVPGIDHAVVWLHDEPRQQLQPLLADHAWLPGAVFRDPRGSLRVGEGAVGSAFVAGQPLIHVPASGGDRRAALNGVAGQSEAVMICLPLRSGTKAVGVLELFNGDGGWASVDLAPLQAIADQLALVIHNAQLADRLAAQDQRLRAYEAVVGVEGDLQQVLERAVEGVLATTGGRGVLLVAEQGGLRVAVEQGWRGSDFAPGALLDGEAAPFAAVLQTGAPQIAILPDDEWWQPIGQDGVDRLAMLPLTVGSDIVGLLAIGLAADDDPQLDWTTLGALGREIGTIIATHRLYAAGQRERRRLRSVIGAIAEGVIICDRDGRLVLANDAARALVGHPLPEDTLAVELGLTLEARDSDGHLLPSAQMPLARGLRGETFQNLDVRITNPSGTELTITCSGAPLLADDGSIDGAVVVFRDVTAIKAHDALRDEFVAVAAHEMRAPLAAIKGYADLLLRREMQRADGSDRDRRGVLMLSRQVDHLVRLVDNLLDVSRLDAGRLELYLQPADLVTLIEASIDRVSMGDANHEFHFNGPESLPILCDQLRLQQVFTNLLSNAARYSAAGTHIWVDVWTSACTIEDGVVTHVDGPDECVNIAVSDQGVGMTPDVQAKVFDRYYRANTATAASGLGLGVYLSREIVQRHGGTISLDSAPGVGTTFYVRLPLNAGTPV
jgi:two-component system, OmpR family, phosphate regulon sensor histidine kinase PhoR